jgi:outer membrane lipoprotein SlyB
MNTATTPTLTTSGRNRQLALVGGALGLFALGALATALVLEAPKGSAPAAEAPAARQATAPAAPKAAAKPQAHAGAPVPLDTQATAAPPACATCGIVESVTAVTKKGEATGIGAVAGGLLGGVVGHQMGGGNGKKAMTAIGAVGGGLAGNEIEKQQRSTTSYQHTIRMADGSTRRIMRTQSLAVGQRVHVDGEQVTPMAADQSGAGGERVLKTSTT